MVDKYRVFIILLIWLKSSRDMIGVEDARYMAFSKSNSIDNANYILNNTTLLAHKKYFVTISIIVYALSINQKFLKLEHPTAFLNKNYMFNLLFVYIISL